MPPCALPLCCSLLSAGIHRTSFELQNTRIGQNQLKTLVFIPIRDHRRCFSLFWRRLILGLGFEYEPQSTASHHYTVQYSSFISLYYYNAHDYQRLNLKEKNIMQNSKTNKIVLAEIKQLNIIQLLDFKRSETSDGQFMNYASHGTVLCFTKGRLYDMT